MSIYDKSSLVLIPSGTKTGKVYSQKPVSGDGDFTFTRSSAATRVNADGNIEKETQNLLIRSNEFNNAIWGKFTNTTYTITTENITDPFGASASVYKVSLTGNGYVTLRQNLNGETRYMTASAYIKKSSSGLNVAIDQSDGDVANSASNTDWQRLSSSHASGYSFSFIDITITGVSGDYFYVSSAQMELGGAARDYIETTTAAVEGGITDNVPRLDYTDSSCPALKLEPQRSNLVPFSEHLESSDWAKTRCTIEDNSTTSPEGVVNASKMTSTDASESYIQDNLTTTGTKVTWSFFAKKGDLDYAHGLVWDLSANGCRQWFNLSTGAVGGTTTFGSGYSVDSATIEDYGNGWYRCAMVVNSTAGTQGCRLNISSADTTIGSAVNSYGYFYGVQLEDASYSTSYIPTYGSSVTRVAEACSKTGISSLIGQTEGTIYWEGVVNGSDNNFANLVTSERNTTTAFSILYRKSSSQFQCAVFDGTTKGQCIGGSVVIGQKHKLAYAYKSGDFVLYVDGVQVDTSTETWTPSATIDDLYLGDPTTFFGFKEGNRHDNTMLFKTRLTNAELADLTTL